MVRAAGIAMRLISHPVLGEPGHYPDASVFESEVTCEGVDSGVVFHFRHTVKNCPEILNLLERGDAVYVVRLSSESRNREVLRRTLVHPPRAAVGTLYVDETDLQGGVVDASCEIVATKNLEFPQSQSEDPPEPISIDSGSILGLKRYSFLVGIRPETPLIRAVRGAADASLSARFDRDRIDFVLPSTLYEKIGGGLMPSTGAPLIELALIVEALAKIRYENDEFEAPWVPLLLQEAQTRGLHQAVLEKEGGQSLVEIAEKLLDRPIGRSIETLYTLYKVGKADE